MDLGACAPACMAGEGTTPSVSPERDQRLVERSRRGTFGFVLHIESTKADLDS